MAELSNELEERAQSVVKRHLVKAYVMSPDISSRFFVVGRDEEYFVTRDSCSCESFQREVITGKQPICKHIRALDIALQKNEVDTFPISTEEYRELRKYLFGVKR
ncbi:MAG: SWIM zinc finger family protein [Candidatus Heimdallarchaeota archaeon]